MREYFNLAACQVYISSTDLVAQQLERIVFTSHFTQTSIYYFKNKKNHKTTESGRKGQINISLQVTKTCSRYYLFWKLSYALTITSILFIHIAVCCAKNQPKHIWKCCKSGKTSKQNLGSIWKKDKMFHPLLALAEWGDCSKQVGAKNYRILQINHICCDFIFALYFFKC